MYVSETFQISLFFTRLLKLNYRKEENKVKERSCPLTISAHVVLIVIFSSLLSPIMFQANHKIWKSAKKQSTQRSYRPGLSRDNCYQENMKETLVNFSLGTFGNVIVPPVSHKSSPSPVKLKKQKASFVQADSGASQHGTARKSPAESQGSYDKCDDGILVEELKLPEVMLHRTQAPQIGCVSRRSLIDVPMHHEFLAGHLNAVTKKDQFDKLKKFETEILCKQDAFERNVMQGTKAIEHLESKLKMVWKYEISIDLEHVFG